MTSGGNNFNDFPANQLNKFLVNTAELVRVQTYIPLCHITNQHYDCVCNRYSISILTPLEYLLHLNEIQVCFSLFSPLEMLCFAVI